MAQQQNAAGRKTHRARWIVLGVVVVLAVVAGTFSHFGGFGTGPSADPDELATYAQGVDDIAVPDGVRVVALGEATHGNSEFQQLKLDVLKVLVEKYGVCALALEGDFGGCEAVNRFIHGGPGTAEDAVAAIGFTIYRTDEMAELVLWMRTYN
jgi:erythromycin esterase